MRLYAHEEFTFPTTDTKSNGPCRLGVGIVSFFHNLPYMSALRRFCQEDMALA